MERLSILYYLSHKKNKILLFFRSVFCYTIFYWRKIMTENKEYQLQDVILGLRPEYLI